jgi:hypothetical protein
MNRALLSRLLGVPSQNALAPVGNIANESTSQRKLIMKLGKFTALTRSGRRSFLGGVAL